MSQSQENVYTEGWKDVQKGRQTLTHKTLPATAGGPIILAFFNLHQHAKKSVYSICLLLRYCQF